MLNIARWTMRITFLVQLLLGIGLWTGNFDVVKPVHIAIGILFVLAMWAIVVLALRAGGPRPLAAGVFVWGAILPVFGLTQEGIVPGGLHWIIQVLHLVAAMIGIAIADMLARRTEGGTVTA